MNTPEPCGNCMYCTWNPMCEEDVPDSAECLKGHILGNKYCKDYKYYDGTMDKVINDDGFRDVLKDELKEKK